MERNLNAEHADSPGRKYAYRFDYILHRYLMRSLAPWMVGTKALELGCYHGDFTNHILASFPNVTVVEGSDELISVARSRVTGDVRFLLGTFEEVDLKEQFDAVFLVHTLEHVDDPVRVLRRIGGWLAPDGKLFLVVPNANAPSRQIAVKMGLIAHNSAVTDGEYGHGHRRTYALDTLERDVRTAGLAVRARGGVMFKPLANFQIDRALEAGIIDDSFLDGLYQLGMHYPDLCASIYLICELAGT